MTSSQGSTLRSRLSVVAMVLAGLNIVAGVAIALVDRPENPEGWVGGLLFAAFTAVPLVLVGLGLRSEARPMLLTTAAGSLMLGLFIALVVLGNWSGYTSLQRVAVPLVMIPSVVFYLVAFGACVRSGVRGRFLSGPA